MVFPKAFLNYSLCQEDSHLLYFTEIQQQFIYQTSFASFGNFLFEYQQSKYFQWSNWNIPILIKISYMYTKNMLKIFLLKCVRPISHDQWGEIYIIVHFFDIYSLINSREQTVKAQKLENISYNLNYFFKEER